MMCSLRRTRGGHENVHTSILVLIFRKINLFFFKLTIPVQYGSKHIDSILLFHFFPLNRFCLNFSESRSVQVNCDGPEI